MSQCKIKVAVVDDDESFGCALGRLFRASGFDVSTFPSAEAFLAAGCSAHPDCLVLDIHLGGISGLDLQRRLRAAGDPAPIIFVTAHDAPGVRAEAERDGCAAYFLKPVAGKPLLEAIRQAARPESHGVAPKAGPSPAGNSHRHDATAGRLIHDPTNPSTL